MNEQARIDLALLAGYIIGTHDLKGDDKPPAILMPLIERAMVSSGERIAQAAGLVLSIESADVDDVVKKLQKSSTKPEPIQKLNDDDSSYGGSIALRDRDACEPAEIQGGGDTNDDAAVADTPEKKERKKMAPRTEEQKQKLRESLAKARAAKGRKPAAFIVGNPTDEPLHEDVDPDDEPGPEPIRESSDYEVDETVVLDRVTDWNTIKRMRTNGMPIVRIARSHKVRLDYLGKFITEQEAIDNRGN